MRWIAIEGLMGAGKTTTARLLGPHLGIDVMLERSSAHPLIDAYYRDPTRFGLETELIFMALQLHQLKVQPVATVVSDFSPAKNLVFAERNLGVVDRSLLAQVDAHLFRALRPAVTVLLDPPPKVCLERIRLRSRAFEQALTEQDLEGLRESYVAAAPTLGERTFTLELTGHETPEDVTARVAAVVPRSLFAQS